MMTDFRDTSNVLVINLFGGPGSGKSTLAAQLFSLLKIRGSSCEYVAEYAKRKTWEQSFHMLHDQFYVSAKQHHEVLMASQHCDVIVTDSPVLLGAAYMTTRDRDAGLSDLLVRYSQNFKNFNVFLERADLAYAPVGRKQSHDEAVQIDASIQGILGTYGQAITEGLPWHTPSGISLAVPSRHDPRVNAEHVISALAAGGVSL